MNFSMIINWLTLEDYSEAKRMAAKRIIAKQSRGSIAAQDGDVMMEGELSDMSRRADVSLRKLRNIRVGA